MQFTIRNEKLAEVEDRASFLEHLIEEYPRLLKEWTEKTDKAFQQDAEQFADGDIDLYFSIYSSMQTAFDDNEYREDLFYQAMLIMTYSYYESFICSLSRKTKTNTLIDAICKSNNIELSKEAKEAINNINSNIRIVRNQLVHNNMGTPQRVDDLMRISKEWEDVHFMKDEISVSGPHFILDSLKKEEMVLKELCVKLGFKHKRVKTK